MRIAVLHNARKQFKAIERAVLPMKHDCTVFADSPSLLRGLSAESFDLLVLQWHSDADRNTLELMADLRECSNHLPSMVLDLSGAATSAQPALPKHATPRDIARCLDLGADDFVTGPWCAAVFAARVRALLRRDYRHAYVGQRLEFGEHVFYPSNGQILNAGVETSRLKPLEFKLALYLFQNLDRVLSREHLQDVLWGSTMDEGSRSLDTHASRVRKGLRLTPEYGYRLQCVYGVGYRLSKVSPELVEPSPLAPPPAATRANASRPCRRAPGPAARRAAQKSHAVA